jgi:hypothetical protein
MDVVQIIKELRQELERIDSLILALDMLQSGRRRGRPPKLLQELRDAKARTATEPGAADGRKKTRKKRKAAVTKGRKKAA